MPKREPGMYEPSSDDIRVFDGSEDDIDEEGSRLPMLLVIALLVVAAFGGVVWLAYTQGVQRGQEGSPRVIAADKGPVRTAPENPGGATPYQGLKIYQQPAPAAEDSAPATEAPPARRAAAPPAKPTPAPALREAHEASVKPAPARPAPAKPVPVTHEAAKTQPTRVAPRTVEPKPVAAPVKAAQAQQTAGGAYVLQIGAYKSEAEAQTAWKRYSARHPAVASFTPDVARADLGPKGVWYRLRIGSYADRATATSACDKLKAAGAACFPAHR